MAISEEELKTARRVVLREVKALESYEPILVIYMFVVFSLMLLVVCAASGHNVLRLISAVGMFTLVAFSLWSKYRGLKRRYPTNMQLLRNLAERDVSASCHQELSDDRSLLEYWSKRFENRGLLWKIVHALGGQ